MMWFWTLLGTLQTLFVMSAVSHSVFRIKPGPLVNATRGEPWPRPLLTIKCNGFLVLRPLLFRFVVTGETCDILEDAIQRYTGIIMSEARAASRTVGSAPRRHARRDPAFAGHMDSLKIRLTNPCEYRPHLNMNESYILNTHTDDPKAGLLTANSIWGILRGLETFTHLLTPSGDGSNLALQCQYIDDEPSLSHRGLLLDTSRHYIPVPDILLTLDAMSYNKLNVFHWHIVDDQSFPYQSTRFPELSAKGAYHPSMIYTPEDVRRIIEYARLRGIRVIPEFDTPGHTRSWGQSYPDLLTTCYDSSGRADGTLGPFDPTESTLYPFLQELFDEIVTTFPDRYLHLGGDEVPFDCWASNPRIREHMRNRHMNDSYQRLEEEYIQALLGITGSLNASSIVWQEVFENGVELAPDTVVHVWTGDRRSKLAAITAAGFPALNSEGWYLDHLATGGDWRKFYSCDPLEFPGTIEQQQLMLGGEACMWGETVDRTNLHSRVWPRACAAAERLWSHERYPSVTDAAKRLEEHTCRMNRRNIPAQPPNGPGFCVV